MIVVDIGYNLDIFLLLNFSFKKVYFFSLQTIATFKIELLYKNVLQDFLEKT